MVLNRTSVSRVTLHASKPGFHGARGAVNPAGVLLRVDTSSKHARASPHHPLIAHGRHMVGGLGHTGQYPSFAASAQMD
jgi:hypothetical protein